MKKLISLPITKEFPVEISVDGATKDFFKNGEWSLHSWKYTKSGINTYINVYLSEVSDEEAHELRKNIKREFKKQIFELKQKEIDQLKDRKSILRYFNNYLRVNADLEEVGYTLSAEEILELILKNGQK